MISGPSVKIVFIANFLIYKTEQKLIKTIFLFLEVITIIITKFYVPVITKIYLIDRLEESYIVHVCNIVLNISTGYFMA